jgi:hypothetical protein
MSPLIKAAADASATDVKRGRRWAQRPEMSNDVKVYDLYALRELRHALESSRREHSNGTLLVPWLPRVPRMYGTGLWVGTPLTSREARLKPHYRLSPFHYLIIQDLGKEVPLHATE